MPTPLHVEGGQGLDELSTEEDLDMVLQSIFTVRIELVEEQVFSTGSARMVRQAHHKRKVKKLYGQCSMRWSHDAA